MIRLREIRKERGFTQQQLADMVGVLNVSLSNYERGTQLPDIETLAKLATALGVTTDALLGRSFSDDQCPITPEARQASRMIDQLPKEKREQAVTILQAVFPSKEDTK